MQIVRPLCSALTKQARRYHVGPEHKPPSMNELPVPSGSWHCLNNERLRHYNGALVLGLTMVTVAFSALRTISNLNFHWYAPKHYEDEE